MKQPPEKPQTPPASGQENKTPTRLIISLDLPPETTLSVTVATPNPEETPRGGAAQSLPAELREVGGKSRKIPRARLELRKGLYALWSAPATAVSRLARFIKAPARWSEKYLFLLSLVFYTLTRLIGLLRFPVNITSEEAFSTVAAADMIANRLHDTAGFFLPAYFFPGGAQRLGASVYLQAFGVALFGQSPWITRALPALLTLLVAFSLALFQRDGFGSRHWWGFPILLAALPGWFLLSHAAPALALTAVFFSAALATSLYMLHDPGRRPFLPYIFLALTAWSSPPGLILSVITAASLLVMDFQSRRDTKSLPVKIFGAAVLLALPLLRALILRQLSFKNFPAKLFEHTFLLDPLTAAEKVRWLLANLAQLANPSFWFGLSASQGSTAFPIPAYGLVHWAFIPLLLAGVWQVIQKRRTPAARLLTLMFLAALVSSAVGKSFFPDALLLLAPLALLASLGLSAILESLHATPAFSNLRLRLAAFLLLSAASLAMTSDAICNGASWSTEAPRSAVPLQSAFELARQYAIAHPDQQIHLSLRLGDQLDLMRKFYTPGYPNILVADLPYALENKSPRSDTAVFVITAQEYMQASLQPVIQTVVPLAVIKSPQNQPDLYLVKFLYRSSVEE